MSCVQEQRELEKNSHKLLEIKTIVFENVVGFLPETTGRASAELAKAIARTASSVVCTMIVGTKFLRVVEAGNRSLQVRNCRLLRRRMDKLLLWMCSDTGFCGFFATSYTMMIVWSLVLARVTCRSSAKSISKVISQASCILPMQHADTASEWHTDSTYSQARSCVLPSWIHTAQGVCHMCMIIR